MTTVVRPDTALEPLRAALIAHAHAEADALRAAAAADGQQDLTEARDRCDTLLAEARAQGEVDAAAVRAAERSRARRAARGIVLAAQRAAYDELRERAGHAVRELLQDPSMRARLEALARGPLGEQAEVHEHGDGGVVAEAPGGRRVDASVEALVARALADLEVETLWAPQ